MMMMITMMICGDDDDDDDDDQNGDVIIPQIPGTWVQAFVCSVTDHSLNRTDNLCPLLFLNTNVIANTNTLKI